ncbi:hypothetical protein AXY1_26 [Achromobacter phage AXY1]|nr:hypothetical protein AXY1_26 [Achromobacter phage AXY1]
MREVRHPAADVMRNEHLYMKVSSELAAKFDRAGIPTLNLVSWSGVAVGALVCFYDELTEEMVYRYYEPGETIKAQPLATLDEMQHLVKKFKPACVKPGPIPAIHRNVSLKDVRAAATDDDEEL